MGKEIGVGVIGLGMGANMLAINEDATSQMEVRALCDSDTARLQRLENQHGITHITEDYRELVARPDIDMVGIYSPDHLHMEHIEAAATAGKHIICTKPMVVSLEQARRVVQLVQSNGIKFLVGQTSRFVPRFMAAHKLYEDGDLGTAAVRGGALRPRHAAGDGPHRLAARVPAGLALRRRLPSYRPAQLVLRRCRRGVRLCFVQPHGRPLSGRQT